MREKLYGGLAELKRTAAFVRTTGVDVWSEPSSMKKKKLDVTRERSGIHWIVCVL